MKKITLALVLCIFAITNAQIRKVGINTSTPKQDLDIEGTLRISNTDLPENQTSSKNLAWIPSDNPNDNDNGLIVQEDIEKPIQILDYRFNISTIAEDYINGYNLNISTDKYTVILMQYNIEDRDGKPAYLHVGTIHNGEVQPLYSRGTKDRGLLQRMTRIDYQTGNYHAEDMRNGGHIYTSSPIVMVYPKNGKWHFYADYPGIRPLAFNWENYEKRKILEHRAPIDIDKQYTWNAKLMIIHNRYIYKEADDIVINTNNNTYNHPILGKK